MVATKKTNLQKAQDRTQNAIGEVNKEIENLGSLALRFFIEINLVQEMLDNIRDVPSESRLEYEQWKKIRSDWKKQAEKIESDYKTAYTKSVGVGVAGVGLGVGIASLGPTAAMGVATTFGVASTGTAIAALHGAAATNAALAWLGGGTLAFGGGGIVAGKALLAMAGPVGWAIAGVAFASSSIALLVNRNNQSIIGEIFTLISERDTKTYNLAVLDIRERIKRIEEESVMLHRAIAHIQSYGIDYKKMTESQQYELGSYVNLIQSSTKLLTDPIISLQPKYSEEDYCSYCKPILFKARKLTDHNYYKNNKNVIISLCNLLYKIELDEKERKLLWNVFRNNKAFLQSQNTKKGEFPFKIFTTVHEALEKKYKENVVE